MRTWRPSGRASKRGEQQKAVPVVKQGSGPTAGGLGRTVLKDLGIEIGGHHLELVAHALVLLLGHAAEPRRAALGVLADGHRAEAW